MAQQEKYPELRPPKISTTPQQPYVLSVHAEEFVPRTKKNPAAVQYQGQMPIHPSSQVHQRIAMAQGGVEQGGGDGSGGGGGGYEYTQIPQHVGATSNGSMMANGSDMGKMSALQNRLSNMQIVEGGDNGKEVSYQQMEAMDYLTEVIAELLDNPGMFDQVQLKLPDKLGELRHDHYVLSSTIEMIFEQSIRESNFRYMGARLCQLLDSLDGPNLRQLLRLKMEDQNNELPQFMSNEQVKVRGATLFLAELYMQLRMPEVLLKHLKQEGAAGRKVDIDFVGFQSFGKIISEHIISAIETLLSKRGPENTKCVCQCLKLCGYELEQDCRDKVEAILKKLQEPQAVQSSTEAMIRSVLELRKNSWGRSEEIATAPAGLSNNLLPVFYGPDGKMLTEEESSFLATNIEAQGPSAYNNYDDDDEFGMVDPDDDPEVQEAYEQFIQSNAQSRLQQQQSAVRFQPDA
uniref:MIF4G domain-containing protein n=1 Tax=Anopheles culicifacies TaxID=139723 RepID=A0A182MWC9_9DIPT